MGALQMYIKAGLPAKAARIAIAHPDISSQTEIIERIASQLVKGGLYERVLEYSPTTSIKTLLTCVFIKSQDYFLKVVLYSGLISFRICLHIF